MAVCHYLSYRVFQYSAPVRELCKLTCSKFPQHNATAKLAPLQQVLDQNSAAWVQVGKLSSDMKAFRLQVQEDSCSCNDNKPCLDAALELLGRILKETVPFDPPFFARSPERLAVAPGWASVSENSPRMRSGRTALFENAFTYLQDSLLTRFVASTEVPSIVV